MVALHDDIVHFLHDQGFVVVSTIDAHGYPATACKSIVEIDPSGSLFLVDLYMGRTYANLQKNQRVCLTAIDEHKFKGFSLKGVARIVLKKDIPERILQLWDGKVTSRVTRRLLRNIHEEKGHSRHPEALLPHPTYMIAVDIEEVTDLTPHLLKEKEN